MIRIETGYVGILEEAIKRHPELEGCREEILGIFEGIRGVFLRGGKLMICGNGGSSADADHMAGELLKSFRIKGGLSGRVREGLPEHLAVNLEGGFPVVPLSSFPAFSSAYLNDRDGEYAYAQLVMSLGKRGDGLLAITTSGNSRNVLHAVELANCIGVETMGLSGKHGGKLKGMAEITVCVPEVETYKVQELHLPVYHAICMMLERVFFGNDEN